MTATSNSLYTFYVIAPFNTRMVLDNMSLIGNYEDFRKAMYKKLNPKYPNKVIIEKVWPAFKTQVKSEFVLSIDVMPKAWWESSSSFKSFNRYMTAINVWADLKGWTTTQMENTIYKE